MKKLISAFLSLFMLLAVTSPALAEPIEAETALNTEAVTIADENIQPHTDGYYYYETKTEYIGESYGTGRVGISAGPNKENGTVSFDQTVAKSLNCDVSYINTVEGSFFDLASISSALGVRFSVTLEHEITGTMTLNVPAGEVVKICYRPVYKTYNVTQEKYYRIDGVSHLVGTEVSTAKVFDYWNLYQCYL